MKIAKLVGAVILGLMCAFLTTGVIYRTLTATWGGASPSMGTGTTWFIGTWAAEAVVWAILLNLGWKR